MGIREKCWKCKHTQLLGNRNIRCNQDLALLYPTKEAPETKEFSWPTNFNPNSLAALIIDCTAFTPKEEKSG